MTPDDAPGLSLVIPLYNEAENLPVLAAEIRRALEPTGKRWESLFVDDGSTDGSFEVLQTLAAEDRTVRILRHRKNAGQSAALAAGFAVARGGIVVTLDADLQNDPADIPALLARLGESAATSDCDAVSGVRQRRQDSWVRRISSRVANSVRNWATDEQVSDVGCSLKAYRREVLERLPMFTGMHRFLPTLVRWNGARLAEIPVNHRPRLHGTAKYGIGNRLFRALADLMAVRWMRTRWIPRGNLEVVEEIRPPAAAQIAERQR
ncbi:MAG: glycosyltransferase family 2 protein [Thermoanaerobaculia bacterium]|nr:glycosyltransferase family 2 protein [Thermoanaerobaculia bacterium]